VADQRASRPLKLLTPVIQHQKCFNLRTPHLRTSYLRLRQSQVRVCYLVPNHARNEHADNLLSNEILYLYSVVEAQPSCILQRHISKNPSRAPSHVTANQQIPANHRHSRLRACRVVRLGLMISFRLASSSMQSQFI
jgi:hypothetical protein